MNKKTLIFAPMAVIATLFATSCNKSWPTISDSDAKELINKVLEEQKNGFANISKMFEINANTKYVGSFNGHTLNVVDEAKYKYDIDNNLLYENTKSEDPEGYSKLESHNIYYDGYDYELDDIYMDGTKKKGNEDEWKIECSKEAKKIFTNISEESCYSIFMDNENFDDLIAEWKETNAELEKNNGYFKYSFTSNDNKTKNVGIKIQIKYVVKETEETPELSEEGSLEYKFENNYPVSCVASIKGNTKGLQKKVPGCSSEAVISGEQSFTVNYTNRHAQNINLNSFAIVERKE